MKLTEVVFLCLLLNSLYCLVVAEQTHQTIIFTNYLPIGGLRAQHSLDKAGSVLILTLCASAHFSIIINFAKDLKTLFVALTYASIQANQTFGFWRFLAFFSSQFIKQLVVSFLCVVDGASSSASLPPYPTRVIVCLAVRMLMILSLFSHNSLLLMSSDDLHTLYGANGCNQPRLELRIVKTFKFLTRLKQTNSQDLHLTWLHLKANTRGSDLHSHGST